MYVDINEKKRWKNDAKKTESEQLQVKRKKQKEKAKKKELPIKL